MQSHTVLSCLVEQEIRGGGIGPVGLVSQLLQNISLLAQELHFVYDDLAIVMGCSLGIFGHLFQVSAKLSADIVKAIAGSGQAGNQILFSIAGNANLFFR